MEQQKTIVIFLIGQGWIDLDIKSFVMSGYSCIRYIIEALLEMQDWLIISSFSLLGDCAVLVVAIVIDCDKNMKVCQGAEAWGCGGNLNWKAR